ncbi:MAG: hypothetical protein F6K32_23325, partial [Desertifilum sp. SIO1I2]|nr:hypothetical protein [Desertifilum sp. SIO1I2]
MKYSYYPGCSLHTTAKEFDLSTQVVMQELGIELEELQDWSCCGGSVAASVSHDVGLAMAARNEAQISGATGVWACAGFTGWQWVSASPGCWSVPPPHRPPAKIPP